MSDPTHSLEAGVAGAWVGGISQAMDLMFDAEFHTKKTFRGSDSARKRNEYLERILAAGFAQEELFAFFCHLLDTVGENMTTQLGAGAAGDTAATWLQRRRRHAKAAADAAAAAAELTARREATLDIPIGAARIHAGTTDAEFSGGLRAVLAAVAEGVQIAQRGATPAASRPFPSSARIPPGPGVAKAVAGRS